MARIILLLFGLMVSGFSYASVNINNCTSICSIGYRLDSDPPTSGCFTNQNYNYFTETFSYDFPPSGGPRRRITKYNCPESEINCNAPSVWNKETLTCSSAPSCNIGEEVWADYAIEDQMPVCTGGCTGTRSPGACYGGGIGCQVKFTITGPCEEDTCEGDECTSGGEQSSSSSDDSESSSSEPSTSSSSASNSSSGNGGDGDGDGGDGNGNGSGSGSSSGNTGGGGGGDDDSGDESSSSGECDPTSSNYFECAGLIEESTSSSPDISYEVSSAVGKAHDDQINDIQDFQGVSFSDKADFFKSKLESFLPSIPTCTPITLQFSYFNVTETIPCEKFDVIKRLLAWVLSFSTVWYIFQLAIKPVDR